MADKFCTKCGSELGEGVKFCTACGTPVNLETVNEVNAEATQPISIIQKLNPKQGVSKMLIGAFLGVCLILGLVLVVSNKETGSNSQIQIKADEMIKDYIRDQATAEKKYKDKKVSVSGMLLHKSQFNNSQDYAMYIANENVAGRNYQIIIQVPKENVGVVNKVQVDDFVHAEGTCIGIVNQTDPTKISVQIKSTKVNQ